MPRHAPAPKQGQEPGSEGKALIEALQDPDNGVRERAVEALARLGGERAIEALKRALQDDDANVREAASEALWQLTGKRSSEGSGAWAIGL